MRVHHLNCGSMRMPGNAHVVCHVLLLETDTGLALVDTGFGLHDIADPKRRLGPYRHIIRPALDATQTAIRQVEALGWQREDVCNIILTHLDLDHIGGLADFPDARVHVTTAEADGAIHHPSWRERIRYQARQWAHGPHLVEHHAAGDCWRGFADAEQLTQVDPGIVLVSLPGHTRGHAAVAIDTGDRWLLHAGDSFYHHSTLDHLGRQPLSVTIQERLVAYNDRVACHNRARLLELHTRAEPDLDIFSAHDATMLQRMQHPSRNDDNTNDRNGLPDNTPT